MLSKVISQANIDHVEKWFEKADKLVIVSHVSPDGDAIGSSLGLYHFLLSQDKTVHVIVPNAFPDFLKWMPGAKDIIQYNRYKEFADKLINEADVLCVLDLNALSRLDDMQDEKFACPQVVGGPPSLSGRLCAHYDFASSHFVYFGARVPLDLSVG